ncbi:BMP family ABC transporter substrate-binding protein [Stetteria hydrogenophila]
MAGVTRRDFLKLTAAFAGGLVLGGVAGYLAGGRQQGGRQAPTTPGATATTTTTSTPAPATTPQGGRKIRALWIYVGPIGDYGWTRAHHDAKEAVDSKYPWLETVHIENVSETEAYNVIKRELEERSYDAVFATSYGFMDAVKRLAREYPEIRFYHCSGPWEEFKDLPNVATYFAEFYQLYYLNGIAAGAVTETCSVGYVPAFLIPEVVRHINAFAIGALHGAKLMGKCGDGSRLNIYVTPPLNSWFAPDKARDAAKALVDQYDVDVIAYTEDSTAIPETAESYWDQGMKVYSFSHYSNMYEYFKKQGRTLRNHLTGQIANWAPIYEYLLVKLYAGAAVKEDVWARIGDFTPIRWRRPVEESTAGQPEGAVYLAPLNTQAIPAKALEEIKRRYEEMKELLFEPFTGPIRGYKIDATGKPLEEPTLKVPEGVRLGRNELWTIDWFHESITTLV